MEIIRVLETFIHLMYCRVFTTVLGFDFKCSMFNYPDVSDISNLNGDLFHDQSTPVFYTPPHGKNKGEHI